MKKKIRTPFFFLGTMRGKKKIVPLGWFGFWGFTGEPECEREEKQWGSEKSGNREIRRERNRAGNCVVLSTDLSTRKAKRQPSNFLYFLVQHWEKNQPRSVFNRVQGFRVTGITEKGVMGPVVVSIRWNRGAKIFPKNFDTLQFRSRRNYHVLFASISQGKI